MAYGSISGRAATNPRSPRAFGVCDGCGEWYNRVDLKYQFDWGGDTLINQRFLYCHRCISKPQPQLKTIILPLDPVPVKDPRPEVPILLQNLNGFQQYVGPQGETIRDPVPTELDPTRPFRTKLEVLESASTGWGLPAPPLVDRSTTIARASVGQRVLEANPDRTYLLFYGPDSLFYAIAQNGTPVLTIPQSVFIGLALYAPTPPAELGTVTAGTGGAVLQNSFKTPPDSVWTGEVWVLGFIAGQKVWCWESALPNAQYLTSDSGDDLTADDGATGLTSP
jgi:hypothetical protein